MQLAHHQCRGSPSPPRAPTHPRCAAPAAIPDVKIISRNRPKMEASSSHGPMKSVGDSRSTEWQRPWSPWCERMSRWSASLPCFRSCAKRPCRSGTRTLVIAPRLILRALVCPSPSLYRDTRARTHTYTPRQQARQHLICHNCSNKARAPQPRVAARTVAHVGRFASDTA